MITISVETDEEEAVVLAALESGALSDALGQPFVIRRGHRSIGGAGTNTVVQFSGSSGGGWPGGAGGIGTCTVIRSHGGNGGLSAPEIVENVRRMRGPLR